jgi:hypothetical protein
MDEPWEEKDDHFYFWADSISEKEICEPMMDILIPQAKNGPLIFRHRHPAGNDEKSVPIFGRIQDITKIRKRSKAYLRARYDIPLKSPDGHDLDHAVLFKDWVKASWEAGVPIGISFSFLKYLDDGKAYWVDFIESSGTHVPACETCNHVKSGPLMSTNEEGRKKGKSYKEFEAELEKMTLEKAELEAKLETLGEDKQRIKDSLETKNHKMLHEIVKQSKEIEGLRKSFSKMKNELEFSKTKGPLVQQIVELEGRPELEEFYKAQEVEYLEDHAKKLLMPRPNTGSSASPDYIRQMGMKALQVNLEDNPSDEEILKNVDPSLRSDLKKFMKEVGGAGT